MTQRTLLGRLLSPAGFGLVLIFFLLPFVTASCGTATEHVEATFTGLDMALGSQPTVSSPDADPATAQELGDLVMSESDLEVLALLSAMAVLAGMAVGILPMRRVRHGAAAAAAVVAAGLAVGAITRVPQRVDEFVSRVLGEDIPEGMTSGSHIRYGFWLALGTLVALAATGSGRSGLPSGRSGV